MARTKKPVEAVRGTYSAMPHAVMDSPAYIGAGVAAKALLCELIRQHNGSNNGRLHLSHKWLAPRGWPSKSTVEKARAELIERGLIVQTKQGGLFIGASWHALTWLPVSNFVGLDIASNQYHPGGWQLCNLPPTTRRDSPAPPWFHAHAAALRERRSRRSALTKKISQPVHRGSTDPTTGADGLATDPTTGAVTVQKGGFPDPTTGDDVLLPLPPAENLSAVQQFQTRIGGRLTTPARKPSPLGRTRHIKLFKTVAAHLIAHRGHQPTRPNSATTTATPAINL